MKLLRCCFISTFFTAWLLLLGQVAVAADFDLGIATSPEGKTLGENLIINKNETTGELFLTTVSGDDSRLILPVSLSNKFEIVMVGNGSCWYTDNIFMAADENKIDLWYIGSSSWTPAFFSGKVELSKADVAWQEKTLNTFKWSFDGNIAKLYINDLFADKVNLTKPDLTYTQLVLRGITHACHIYELKGGDGSGITTPTTGGDFESGKQAGIQQCVANPASCGISVTPGSCGDSGGHAAFNSGTGELHIPFVDVPGAFGLMQTYEVYLIQQPATFTFDLDLGRIVQK